MLAQLVTGLKEKSVDAIRHQFVDTVGRDGIEKKN